MTGQFMKAGRLSKKKFVRWLSLSKPPYTVQLVITSLRSVRKRATSSMTAVGELIRQPLLYFL